MHGMGMNEEDFIEVDEGMFKTNIRRKPETLWEKFDDKVILPLHWYILNPIANKYHNARWFFRNLRYFWKFLCEYRNWDSAYLHEGIILMLNDIKPGLEIFVGGEEEQKRIDEVTGLLRDVIDQKYHDDAFDEIEKGDLTKEERLAVYQRAKDREEEAMKRAFNIIGEHSLKWWS